MRLVICFDLSALARKRFGFSASERGTEQGEVLDPLRAPVGGQLRGRHAPDLLRVGLEEVLVQAPAEARHVEAFERVAVASADGCGPRGTRARNARLRSARGSSTRSSGRAGSRRNCPRYRMRLWRGRCRKFSEPRISNHRSSTAVTLVKNRWPPMSKRQPSRTTVRLIPPTTSSDSRMVTPAARPALASMYAAVRPAGPAPMTTTDRSPGGRGAGCGGKGSVIESVASPAARPVVKRRSPW